MIGPKCGAHLLCESPNYGTKTKFFSISTGLQSAPSRLMILEKLLYASREVYICLSYKVGLIYKTHKWDPLIYNRRVHETRVHGIF